jgi:DNA-binding SARP family transcriptional activator
MQVRLLGPVDVIADGVSRPVNGLRRKAVLTVLALDSGVIVSSDRLADVVWGGEPPATSQNTLQRHVSYLRQVLGSRDVIVARSPGYLFDPVRAGTDVAAARRLIDEGMQAAGRRRWPALAAGGGRAPGAAAAASQPGAGRDPARPRRARPAPAGAGGTHRGAPVR